MTVDERTPLIPDWPCENGLVTNRQTESQKSSIGALTLALALFSIFLGVVDESFLLGTYGEVASYFQNLRNGPWLLTGYTMGYCVSLPIYGQLGDMYGRKRPLLVSYCFLAVGCLVSGTARSLAQVIVGRVLAGIGCSGVEAMVTVIITDLAPLNQVAVVRSYTNIAAISGRSFGVPIGGLLIDTVGWRWLFVSQVPMALGCLGLAMWRLPLEPLQHGKLYSKSEGDEKASSGFRSIDFPGVATFAFAMTAFLLILDQGGSRLPWSHPIIICLVVACVCFWVLFFIVEGYVARRPLIPLRLLATNGIGFVYLVQALQSVVRLSVITHTSPYFIRTKNVENVVAAACVVPSCFGSAFAALITGQIIQRRARYKTLSIISIVFGLVSYAVVFATWRKGAEPWASFYTFPAGMSAGALLATQFIGLSASTPQDQHGTAVSLYYLSQQVGILAGVSSSTTIVTTIFRGALHRSLRNVPDNQKIIDGVLNNQRFAFSLPEKVQSIVRSNYLFSFQFVPVLSFVALLLALPIVVYVREQPLKRSIDAK